MYIKEWIDFNVIGGLKMNEIRIFFTELIQPGTLIRGIKVGFTLNREDKEMYIDCDCKLTREEIEQIIKNAIENNVEFKDWED
jgi:hypothetical protein